MNYKVLKARREQLGLTQAEVAKAVGIAQPNYARLESGANENPKLKTLEAIAKALRCPLAKLLD